MRVINRHTASKEELAQSVYVGRGTPLGNWFPTGNEYGNNDNVVKLYRKKLARKLIARDAKVENALRGLKEDSILACSCKPKACHGDVLVEFWGKLYGQGGSYEENLLRLRHELGIEDFNFDPSDDGVTHINVWSKGRTELGRLLSNFAHTPFKHPEYGYFASVEAFWYWLSLGQTNNELRGLYGYQSKQAGKLIREEVLKHSKLPRVEDFEAKIKKAILCKIEQNEGLAELLRVSELPLSHYYVWGTPENFKQTYPEEYAWIHEYISDVRDYLKKSAVRLVIAGSRSITEFIQLEKAYHESKFKAIEIVSGRAPGVDTLGEALAKKLKLPIAYFPADWEGLGRRAGFVRNVAMADYADAGLILWDGKSPGTGHMLSALKTRNKPFKLVTLA